MPRSRTSGCAIWRVPAARRCARPGTAARARQRASPRRRRAGAAGVAGRLPRRPERPAQVPTARLRGIDDLGRARVDDRPERLPRLAAVVRALPVPPEPVRLDVVPAHAEDLAVAAAPELDSVAMAAALEIEVVPVRVDPVCRQTPSAQSVETDIPRSSGLSKRSNTTLPPSSLETELRPRPSAPHLASHSPTQKSKSLTHVKTYMCPGKLGGLLHHLLDHPAVHHV
jgi:hypothetical protein